MSDESRARNIFIAEIEQLGGAERSVLALSNFLHARGLAHQVLTYADGCNFAQYAAHPLTVVDLHASGGPGQKISKLKRYLSNKVAGERALLTSGYQPALHATLAGVRGFHTLMHDTPALFGDQNIRSLKGRLRIGVSNAILRYGLHTGGTTMVTSEFLRDDCRREFGVTAEICRMGGLSDSSLAAEAGKFVTHGSLRLLSVCRVEANKRVDWMLQSLAQLERAPVAPLTRRLSDLANWHLDVVGKGSMVAELEDMATELGIAKRVTFHGFVADIELEAMYSCAHLFLMPAVQGYGIPAIESLSRRVPVLLHRDSGVSDILLETPWATVMHGGEEAMPSSLATALQTAMDARHLKAALPPLPTEDDWAAKVAELCGWL